MMIFMCNRAHGKCTERPRVKSFCCNEMASILRKTSYLVSAIFFFFSFPVLSFCDKIIG